MPSPSKRCSEGKDAIIKTLPRQRKAEKPLSETRLSDLSFSLSLFRVSLYVCVFGRYKEIRGERKVGIN